MEELSRSVASCLFEIFGYSIFQEYVDNAISGSIGCKDRPELDAVLKAVMQRKFQMNICWSIDRLDRTIQHLIEFLNERQVLKTDLCPPQQSMDASTSSARIIF